MIRRRRKVLLGCASALLVGGGCSDTPRESPLAGGSSTETSNTLAARFVDDDGRPVAHAAVSIRPADWGRGEPGDSISAQGRTRLDTTLGADGSIRVVGFRPGRYAMEIRLGELALRRELSTSEQEVLDTLVRTAGLAGVFQPRWAGVVRLLGTDLSIPTDSAGAFRWTDISAGTVLLDFRADSAGVVRKGRRRTFLPPRSLSDLGDVELHTLRDEDPSDWRHRQVLVIDNTLTGITRDVPDFPLWIPLPDSIRDQLRTDRSDLRVRDEHDSARTFEISTARDGTVRGVWTRLARIDGSSKEHFVSLLWGNEEAPIWSSGPSVFDLDFGWEGAWHFEGHDSCAVAACSPFSGVASFDSGIVGEARRFEGTGSLVARDAGRWEPSDFSLSLWVNLEDIAGSEARLVWKDSDAQSALPTWGLVVRKSSEGAFTVGLRTRGGHSDSGVFAPILSRRWVQVAATLDRQRGKAELFVDGISAGTYDVDAAAPAPRTGDLRLGEGFVGRLDELRFASVVRSAAWFDLERVNFTATRRLLHP
ncbi:MAG: LamG domain-containing protein [Fibrobacteria bacterium]|nr:LamG domain-containing protein [Fibrobacteria bacterium]